jgi:hypothetical protein
MTESHQRRREPQRAFVSWNETKATFPGRLLLGLEAAAIHCADTNAGSRSGLTIP